MIVPGKVLDPIGPTAAAAAQRDNRLVDLLEVNHGFWLLPGVGSTQRLFDSCIVSTRSKVFIPTFPGFKI